MGAKKFPLRYRYCSTVMREGHIEHSHTQVSICARQIAYQFSETFVLLEHIRNAISHLLFLLVESSAGIFVVDSVHRNRDHVPGRAFIFHILDGSMVIQVCLGHLDQLNHRVLVRSGQNFDVEVDLSCTPYLLDVVGRFELFEPIKKFEEYIEGVWIVFVEVYLICPLFLH